MNSEIEEIIQYSFKNKDLLKKALTHSSFCREHHLASIANNERLEFIGDAFFDAIIGVELYNRLESVDEGKLTKTRALIVCEKSLAMVGQKLDIGKYLYLGKGEEHTGGRHRESTTANSVEALIGAVFLDSDYKTTKEFVLREFDDIIDAAIAGKLSKDYKTCVQESLQEKGKKTVILYQLDKEEGPDHDKTFYVHLVCDGKPLGSGSGKSKKEAEQNAAKATLEGRLI